MLIHQGVGIQHHIYQKMERLYILPQIDQRVLEELIFIRLMLTEEVGGLTYKI